MKRIGFQKLLLIFLMMIATAVPAFGAGAQSTTSSGSSETAAQNPEWAPSLVLPNDTTLALCAPTEICYDVKGSDPDSKDTLTLTLISGPITFSPKKFASNSFTQNICFTPTTSKTYRFIWKVSDQTGKYDIDTVKFNVTINWPPVIADQSFSGTLCSGDTTRALYVVASDGDHDPLRYVLLSGNGTINDSTGELVYYTSQAGVNTFSVAVYDKCAADTAIITDTVTVSQPPVLVTEDKTIFACDTCVVSFDVIAHDPEGGPVQIVQSEGPGEFQMVTDTSGRTTFYPAKVDSARYMFVYCIADDCLIGSANQYRVPICILDTVVITVKFNRAPVLSCPGEKTFPACTRGPLCWSIEVSDPDGGQVDLTVISGNATLEGNQVCVNPNESGSFDVTIVATDSCGAKDTCTTHVTTGTNHPPVVTAGDNFSMALCKSEQVCVSVWIDDVDQNIASVIPNYGTYDKPGNKICFMADTAGIYTIITTATDSCGATDSDTSVVTISINASPVVHLGADTSFNLCQPEEICLPLSVTDDNIKSVYTSFGQIRDGKVCFTPEVSGTVTIIVTAADECNVAVADTQIVHVVIGHPALLSCHPIYHFFGCMLDSTSTFCFSPLSGGDTSDVTLRVLSGNATVDGHQICVKSDMATEITVVIEATGSCGTPDTCTSVVRIHSNEAPVVHSADDFSVFLCQPGAVCFSATVDDMDVNLMSVLPNVGSYDRPSQKLCFNADTSGLYTIVLTATDSCGEKGSDTTVVSVWINQLPEVSVGNDSTIKQCEPGEICIPAYVIDENIATIYTSLGAYSRDSRTVCFTPDTSGLYTLVLGVVDSCGKAAADTVKLNITTGHKPTVVVPDSTIYVCYPKEICLPVSVNDVDGDLTSVTVNRGKYKNGTVCFVPYNFGAYPIIVTATDRCGNIVADTAIVTVRTDQTVNIIVPNDTSVFLCEPDTLCFPIGGIPSDATVKFFGTNLKWHPENQTVCFYSDCCLQNIIRVEVTTACGTKYTKTFIVSVQTNSSPIVAVPRDTTVFACEPGGLVCLPVAVADLDSNVSHVVVSFGDYDAYRQRFCFVADTAGTYTITATATDSCGLYGQATSKVHVKFNHAPIADFIQNDGIPIVCGTEPIQYCGVVNARDVDSNIVNISVVGAHADFDPTTKKLCWTIADSGQYSAVITVTDACGLSDSITVGVFAERRDSVKIWCQQPQDNEQFCKTDTIKIPQQIFGNPTSVISNIGYWKDGYLYLPADTTKPLNTFNITLIAVGTCNVDTCIFTYLASWIDNTEITCPNDTTVALCRADTLSYQIRTKGYVTPGNLFVNPPAYFDNYTLKVPVTGSGAQTYTIIANGMCGSDTCSFNITSTMNTPPVVDSRDTTLLLCNLQQVCLPIHVTDLDGNITSITTSLGEVLGFAGTSPTNDGTPKQAVLRKFVGDEASHTPVLNSGKDTTVQVCFTPDHFGEYKIVVTASDACVSVVDTVVVTVNSDGSVAIVCPQVEPANLCAPNTLCVPITVTGDGFVVTPSFGTYENGQLCFVADTSGTYHIRVIATASCNADTCDLTIPITIQSPVEVACPGDTTVFYCDGMRSITLPVTITGSHLVVVVSPQGAEWANGQLNIPLSGNSETIPVKVVAANSCYTDSCQFTLTVKVNQKPTLSVEPSIDAPLCTLDKVCIKFHVSDPDNNLVELRSSLGVINDSILCFTPTAFGDFTINILAIDACNDTTTATTVVHVTPLAHADITCPSGSIFVSKPLPDSVRIDLPITPANAVVTVYPNGYYDKAAQQLVIYLTEPGSFVYQVAARTECSGDTCDVRVEAGQYVPPQVECAGTIDTTLCLNGPDTICFPVTITGTAVNVTVSPIGTYANGTVCVPVNQSGPYDIMVIASNLAGADTCTSRINVLGGHPPIVLLPNDTTIALCNVTGICLPLTVTKTDFGIADISVQGGRFVNNDGMYVCFDALRDTVLTIVATVTDSCGKTAVDSMVATVKINKAPIVTLESQFTRDLCAPGQVCIPVAIEDANLMSVVTNGTYNPETHNVCFDASASGVYHITVTATDSCGAATTKSTDVNVRINHKPIIVAMHDTTIYMCSPQYVCLPTAINDPDGELLDIKVNRGKYENGAICFAPYDSGTYEIIVTATDACGAVAADTALVHVKTDMGLQLVCPKDTTIFQCQPDTLCFPIGGIPDGATVKVLGTGVKYNPATKSVCFYSDCCLENTIKVLVTTKCGTYSCQFTVFVQTNSKPVVALGRDSSILSCGTYDKICLPVAVNDIDNNVVSVTAVGGDYDAYRQIVCLTPTHAGTYPIIVTATDACGLSDIDTVIVTVRDNQPPTVFFTATDTLFEQCQPTQICLPVSINDPDGNIAQVGVDGGTYNPQTGQLCITPTGAGRFCATIVVADKCGARSEATYCVTVIGGQYVDITCPSPRPTDTLCAAGPVCIPVAIAGVGYEIQTSFGNWTDGQLCFNADTSGTYVIKIKASAQCNADSCTIAQVVKILDKVEVACPGNQNVFLCAADTLCYDLTLSSSVTNVTVSAPAYLTGNQVCLPILQAGLKNITVIATGKCGADTCSFTVNATFNSAPIVNAGKDTTLTECTLKQVCLPFSVTDANSNIAVVTVSTPATIVGNTICFTPPSYGVFDFIITASDSCGAQDKDTVRVTYNQGASANITCPNGVQFASLCKADSVFIVAPITPSNAVVIVSPSGNYNPATGKISFYVTSGGTKHIKVIASAQCGADTCEFDVQVTFNQAPHVVCAPPIDTLMCLAQSNQLCFPVTVTGTGVTVQVKPAGTYSAGVVCIPVTTAGKYDTKIIATGVCGADSCTVSVNVRANQKPVLTLPTDLTIERCPQDTNTVCIAGFRATDAESPVTLSKVCGIGNYTAVRPDSGSLCFKPTEIKDYLFCFEATDGCHTVTDTFTVHFVPKPDCDVCVKVSIEGGKCSPVGLHTQVTLNVQTNESIGGFDLLTSYDASALVFQSASIAGSDINGWEYFTWKLGGAACGSACPSGIVRFVGIADINNGPAHPPDSTLHPNGALVYIDFLIKNDQNLGGQFVPVNFVWYDCADNSFSNPAGTVLFIDRRIYNNEDALIWDETDDATYKEADRPFGMGAPDSCLNLGGKTPPTRCIDFFNGGVCIISADSIDDRGDINMNGLAYEVADAVMFSNYFIIGLGAFGSHVPGSIAASDVNADGITLTVADLALLIRIVVGDAPQTPKLSPYDQVATVQSTRDLSTLSVTTETVGDIGAAYLVWDVDPTLTIGEVTAGSDAYDMNIISSVDNGRLKVLIYNIGRGKIESGERNLLNVPVTGSGSMNLSHIELVDYQGKPYTAKSGQIGMPDNFVLNQNYPNPFNPTTVISFGLPAASDWSLQIYNITGALVRQFSGSSDAGTVEVTWDGKADTGSQTASGIYLYKLQVGGFSDSKKMILLK